MRASRPDELVVGGPVAADHREADEEADEVRHQVVERVGEVVDAVLVHSFSSGTAIPTTSRVMAIANTPSLNASTRENSSVPRS